MAAQATPGETPSILQQTLQSMDPEGCFPGPEHSDHEHFYVCTLTQNVCIFCPHVEGEPEHEAPLPWAL